MYIATMLDDENYTEPAYHLCESIEDGFEWFKNYFCSDEYYHDDETMYKVNGNRCDAKWYTYTCGSWSEAFAVCEVFELNDKPYVLIWHHAYNGVDFSVRQFDTFEEANAVMRAEAADIYIDEAKIEPEDNEVTPEDWSAIVDDGYEWNCWDILKRSELK